MKQWHDFDRQMNEVEDREILRFVQALKWLQAMRVKPKLASYLGERHWLDAGMSCGYISAGSGKLKRIAPG